MNKIKKQNCKYDFIKTSEYLPKNCYLVGVKNKNNKIYIGIIDKNGNQIVPPMFDKILCNLKKDVQILIKITKDGLIFQNNN